MYGDLSNLPPLLTQAGTQEVLLADATRLAQRAIEADVKVILNIVPGMMHVFQSNEGHPSEAGKVLVRAGAFIGHAISFIQALA